MLKKLVLGLLLSAQAFAGSPVIFSGTDAKALKSNLDLNGTVKILSGSANPTSSAQNAPAGSLYLSTGQAKAYVKTDAGSSTNWTDLSASSAPLLTIQSKTGNYTVLTTDDLISVDASSGAFTLTLYDCNGNTGERVIVKRTDNTPANAVTIDGDGGDTIDGAATRLMYFQWEEAELVCNGTNWIVRYHNIPSIWVSYDPDITGFGTESSDTAFWRITGDKIAEIKGQFTAGTVEAAVGGASIPTFLTLSTTGLSNTGNTTAAAGDFVGFGSQTGGNTRGVMVTAPGTSTSIVYFGGIAGSANNFNAMSISSAYNSSQVTQFKFEIPITQGW